MSLYKTTLHFRVIYAIAKHFDYNLSLFPPEYKHIYKIYNIKKVIVTFYLTFMTFFPCNCEFISHNSDLISQNFIDIKVISEFCLFFFFLGGGGGGVEVIIMCCKVRIKKKCQNCEMKNSQVPCLFHFFIL